MTSAAIPIYQGQDFYVPAFEVRLANRPAGQEVIRDIMSVTYKDSIKDIDSFELTINNWDADTLGFKYSDQKLFDPGKQLDLSIGYQGQLRKVIAGEITSLRPSFPAGGGSTLAVSGLNILHRFRTKQESRTYTNVTDSEVARKIGQRLNVDMQAIGASDEPRLAYLVQDNQYDIIFLMERARRIGYEIVVVEGASKPTLKYQPSTARVQPAYQLTYGKSLIDFQPELTTANQVGKVTVRGWDNVKKKKIEFTATRQNIKTKGVGQKGGQKEIEDSVSKKEEIIADKPVESEAEARKLAIEILDGIAKEMVKGKGSVPGLPDIRAGTILEITGVGDRFSGRYYVTGTSHTVGGGGYTTQFDCRREEI
jgi:phage protein D